MIKPGSNLYSKTKNKLTNGFTIIELVVVVAIIGILATVSVLGFENIQSNTRNTSRSSKITVLSEALEKYYEKNGAYPSCAQMTATPTTIISTTLKGLDSEVLTTPTATKGTNSITCVNPTSDTFGYVGGGAEYSLKYKNETTGVIISFDSRHHAVSVTYTLAISAGTGGTVNAGGTYNAGTSQTITATPNANYTFSSWSGSGCGGAASHSIIMDSNKSCTANFNPVLYVLSVEPGTVDGENYNYPDSSWGTVGGGGVYTPGATAYLSASPRNQYFGFEGWQGDSGCGDVVTVNSNMTCVGYFFSY